MSKKQKINYFFMTKLIKYATARIQIKNYGNKEHDINLLKKSDKELIVRRPEWLQNNSGSGFVVESTKGSLDLVLECVKKGELKLSFRAIKLKDKNNINFPIYIDYTNITVNGKIILNENKTVWHDRPFDYTKKVEDGEIIILHVEWQPIGPQSQYIK